MTSSTPPTHASELPSPGRQLRDRRGAPRPPAGAMLAVEPDLPLRGALTRHWPEYLIEALFLMGFVFGAGIVTTFFETPGSVLRMPPCPTRSRGACSSPSHAAWWS